MKEFNDIYEIEECLRQARNSINRAQILIEFLEDDETCTHTHTTSSKHFTQTD